MGICGSSDPKDPVSVAIKKQMNSEKNNDEAVKKLLLLGAGGSGKSTVFKQLKTIHGSEMSKSEKMSYKSIIVGNVIDFMKTLVEQSKRLAQGDKKAKLAPMPECHYGKDVAEHAELLLDQPANYFPKTLDDELGEAIEALWADKGIKLTYDERSKFQMQDSASYFFNERMHDIRNYDYIPEEQDVLRARVRTTGIVEQEFMVKKHKFAVFDVGGQRNERRKWMHCFDNVTGVIFVASLSGYDQKLLEDDQTNRMVEALDLFAELNDSTGRYGPSRKPNPKERKAENLVKFKKMGEFFIGKPMILFLNKSDLYEDKIMKVPLNACPYFNGMMAGGPKYKVGMMQNWTPKDGRMVKTEFSREDKGFDKARAEDGIKFIYNAFKKRNNVKDAMGSEKAIYMHVTNATDKEIIKKVFLDVQHILISQSLNEAGLL